MWKVYFWIFTVLSVIGIVFGYGSLSSWAFVELLEVTTGILSILCLYSFVFKKRIFDTQVWQVILLVSVIGFILEMLYKFTPFNLLSSILESRQATNGQDVLLATLISLPAYYANYQLAYPQKTVPAKKAKK